MKSAPKRQRNMMIAAGYEGASNGRRLSAWQPGGQSINALLSSDGDQLRRRSRDVARSNPWAKNGIDSFVRNAIGTGIKPQSKHPKKKTRELLNALFTRWTDESDAAGTSDFYGQQRVACRGVVEGGEILARLRPRLASDGLTVPLQIQLLEPEHLPLNKNENLPNGNVIRSGKEFNGIGKCVAYWLYPQHPGEIFAFSNSLTPVRVPAEFICHIFEVNRAGQHRGEPRLASVLVRLHELDKYEDAELVRKEMVAMITHFITEVNPQDPVGDETGQEDEDGVPIQAIQPGSTVKLRPGESMIASQAADVGMMFTEFMHMNLYAVAAGMGITFEMLTGNLKGVSFSSIRQGVQEFRRGCEMFQHQTMAFQFCRPIWAAFIDAAALAGKIDAAEYALYPERYLAVEWQPQKWGYVDPEKDLAVDVGRVRAGFTSQSDVINSQGDDPDRVRAAIAADNAANDAAGLRFDSDGRQPRNGDVASANANQKVIDPKLSDGQPNEVIQ